MELEIDYDLLEEKIAHIMAKAPREDEVLWDADECAAYLHFNRRYFRDTVSKLDSFPRPRGTGFVWLKSEVVRWAKG